MSGKLKNDNTSGGIQIESSAGGGEACSSSTLKNKDAFMTDAIQLIGVIYKYAKMRNIPGPEFERIIVNSYDVAWKIQGNGKGGGAGLTKKKPFA